MQTRKLGKSDLKVSALGLGDHVVIATKFGFKASRSTVASRADWIAGPRTSERSQRRP